MGEIYPCSLLCLPEVDLQYHLLNLMTVVDTSAPRLIFLANFITYLKLQLSVRIDFLWHKNSPQHWVKSHVLVYVTLKFLFVCVFRFSALFTRLGEIN